MIRYLQHQLSFRTLVELAVDGLLCFLAVILATVTLIWTSNAVRGYPMSLEHAVVPGALFALLMAVIYASLGVYRRDQGSTMTSMMGRALLAIVIGCFPAYMIFDFFVTGGYARHVLSYVFLYLLIGLVGLRSMVFTVRKADMGAKRVLIIGTGKEARAVATELTQRVHRNYMVVGFCPSAHEAPDQASDLGQVFSRDLALDKVVNDERIDEIIVAVSERRGGSLNLRQLLDCRVSGVPVLDLAAFYERTNGEVPLDSLKASWLIYGQGFIQHLGRTATKRIFDIVVSLFLLSLAWPIMIVTATLILLEDGGPIFFRQERVGLRGKSFRCTKFRSMGTDAEKDGVARWATVNDPRVTRVGSVIRKLRIDELPQLLNVLRGEMSMVGPRPERPTFVAQLAEQVPFYQLRHSVKPGLTGWAQVRYSYGATFEEARKKLQFDLYYVKNHSLLLDLLVIIETVRVVLFREGAQ